MIFSVLVRRKCRAIQRMCTVPAFNPIAVVRKFGTSAERPSAKPLFQPPTSDDSGSPIVLSPDCGVDLEAESIPTISIIGPSRRGKSVLAGLIAGGDPTLFPQSHSSVQAMTSGTHICETPVADSAGGKIRIIDTEGLSHVGRSRSRREALVRQFLVSTYLTSSWIVWLDSEVLSTGFFTMMWLVHDYVVDVLKIKNAAGNRLPKLMYIRTQETEVQRCEYREKFTDFAAFFSCALEGHEDADILKQMFSPGRLHGHALPIWTMDDLKSFESGNFWQAGHCSPFKDAVGSLRDHLLTDNAEADNSLNGPPLLALAAIEQHLPRIARLEAFDPRDHEATKIARLRNHLRATYGRVTNRVGISGAGGAAKVLADVDLLNLFDPEDRDVRKHNGRIDDAVEAKFKNHCKLMRLNPDVARMDAEVAAVLKRFRDVADAFTRALECFVQEDGPLSEREILVSASREWKLDPAVSRTALSSLIQEVEGRFLQCSGFSPEEMRRLRVHERLRWRIDDCVMRLRGKVSVKMTVQADDAGLEQECIISAWRLGEWRYNLPPKDGKTRASRGVMKPREYALWTDGTTGILYEETAASASWSTAKAINHFSYSAPGMSPSIPMPHEVSQSTVGDGQALA